MIKQLSLRLSQNPSLLFFPFALVYLILITLSDALPMQWAIKILPILVLFAVALRRYKTQPSTKLKWFIFGLVFCMGGDVFLAVDRENLFVFGLGSFLIGHLFYMAAMAPVTKQNVIPLTLLVAYGVAMMSLLTPNLGELLVPVFIYMLVLLFMAAACMTSTKSNFYLILGGVSFTLSDSLIGLDKFYSDIPMAPLWIMITYYLAQYCLTKGFLTQSSDAKN